MAELRILPPKGQDSFPIFLPSGHSVRVYRTDPDDGKTGTVIPTQYHKKALAEGCIYVGTDYDQDEEGSDDTADLILAGVEAIIDRDEATDLDDAGRPTLKAIKAQVGFNVTRAQLNDAWNRFQESLA
ncbi:hypothetical protein [Pseudomonas typographi]|uniref:hypothetical protein n=1 Tax=Pseudomonas typographi TaxID=2715964 RepID=UPI001683FB0E|nr:hypothetical protein [Pseudomonas typographi]MBD1554772.1 hypothetical protein [Pseudomonas typographi]